MTAEAAVPLGEGGRRVRHQLSHCLGRGAHGTVFIGLDETTGEQVAVKQIVFPHNATGPPDPRVRQRLEGIMNEISLLRRLAHPHVVRYLGAERDGGTLWIYMEYISGGTLSALVRRFGQLPRPLTRKFLRHVLLGLEYLHGLRVIHRDVKGDNVLLRPSGEAMLCDFGTSKQIEDCLSVCGCLDTVCGTPQYMAPEVVTGERYGLPADIWSTGCLLYEMLSGVRPFSDMHHPHATMFRLATEGAPPALPDSVADEQGRELLQQCCMRDPRSRPTAPQLLRHPYLAPEAADVAAAALPADIAENPAAQSGRSPPRAAALSSSTPSRRAATPPSGDAALLPTLPAQQPAAAGPSAVTPLSPSAVSTGADTGSPGASPSRLASGRSGYSSPSSALPVCAACRRGVATWSCTQCAPHAAAGGLPLCPLCWDRIHEAPEGYGGLQHRKAPLMFAQRSGGVQLLSPSRGGAPPTLDPGRAACGAGGVVLSDGLLVELLSADEVVRGMPSARSPGSSSAASSVVPQWSCPKCTFLNHGLLPHCEQCGRGR